MNRVIFTNGCFDILHRMHIELLKFCKSRGDYVIVGLNSDASVKALKGDKRPINKEDDRKYVLESLKFVDEVIIFEEETPFNLVKELRPDEIVKGGDYKVEDIAGHEFAPVVLFNYNNSYSTTKALEKLNS
jgi:D-beta-D-heptose 7-phosphate kinase/D-beta-D-heptose 1-phosphate adenosyltransferase